MTAIDQYVAHVGLDWADKKHDVCVQFKNGERIFHVVEHTPEAEADIADIVALYSTECVSMFSRNELYFPSYHSTFPFSSLYPCIPVSKSIKTPSPKSTSFSTLLPVK